jgi:hypothetical protein
MTHDVVWGYAMRILWFLLGCDDANYNRRKGKWHYDRAPVDPLDEPVNLTVIDKYFAKDIRTGFYQGSRIYAGNDASDGATFEVLNSWYAKDRYRVYYCDTERNSSEFWGIAHTVVKVVKSADPATFRMMSDGYTPRDKRNVFRGVDVVPVRDIASYELLAHDFSKDKISAYYKGVEIKGSAAKSFVALDAYYAKDHTSVYFVDGFYGGGTIMEDRSASFRVLGDGYASDGERAWYKGAVITRSGAASLVSLKHMGYAKTLS